ncbi:MULTISPECIES: response regulator transcription factor [Ramlibacter]|nr:MULTISPECIES: response regulator [Ramlibacter]MBA2964231.1 response regulator [Ramlibacter sp. CGMCC 1.13660]
MTEEKDKPGQRSGTGAQSVLQHMAHDARESPGPSFDRSNYTILVVDDIAASRYASVRLLQVHGYKTREASDGSEALLFADSCNAVLLDVNLPDINGVEVCRQLKAQSPGVPVVLMSAFYVDDLHTEVGLSAGADAYLYAGLTSEQLGGQFDQLLAPAAPD